MLDTREHACSLSAAAMQTVGQSRAVPEDIPKVSVSPNKHYAPVALQVELTRFILSLVGLCMVWYSNLLSYMPWPPQTDVN